jgi:hypothetical protein
MTYPQHPGGWKDQPPYSGPPGYPPPYGFVPIQRNPPINGMAIAALVVACTGVLGLCPYGLGGWIGAIGAVLGHVARRQIRERGERGDGLALAGIIVGWIATGLFVLAGAVIAIAIWFAATNSESDTASFIQLMVG